MTSFLLIPTTFDARSGRRVDLAGIVRLFAEPAEPMAVPPALRPKSWFLAGLLILLCAFGDTVLIARPDALMSCLAGPSTFKGLASPPARS